jgi:hypothetical protein
MAFDRVTADLQSVFLSNSLLNALKRLSCPNDAALYISQNFKFDYAEDVDTNKVLPLDLHIITECLARELSGVGNEALMVDMLFGDNKFIVESNGQREINHLALAKHVVETFPGTTVNAAALEEIENIKNDPARRSDIVDELTKLGLDGLDAILPEGTTIH